MAASQKGNNLLNLCLLMFVWLQSREEKKTWLTINSRWTNGFRVDQLGIDRQREKQTYFQLTKKSQLSIGHNKLRHKSIWIMTNSNNRLVRSRELKLPSSRPSQARNARQDGRLISRNTGFFFCRNDVTGHWPQKNISTQRVIRISVKSNTFTSFFKGFHWLQDPISLEFVVTLRSATN